MEIDMFSTSIDSHAVTLDQLELSPELQISWGNMYNLSGVYRSKDNLCITIPLDDYSFFINGHLVSSQQRPLRMVISKKNNLIYFSVRKPLKFIQVWVDPVHFMYLYEILRNDELDVDQSSMFIEFQDQVAKEKLIQLILSHTHPISNADLKLKSSDATQLSDQILKTLILGLSVIETNPERTYCNTLALRAHEIIVSQPPDKLTILEVCEKLRASSRSLQEGFKHIYGIGFIEYHKLYRLNKIREYIRKNGMKFGELTDVMMMFGFNHSGRFASEYKKFFGVLPSQDNKLNDSG